MCRGLLWDMILYIFEMLWIDLGKILFLLDKMRIWCDDFYDVDKRDVFLLLGSFIFIVMYNFLNLVFEVFIFGEYVGYELDDLSFEL